MYKGLKVLRHLNNITLCELGKMTDIDQSYLWQIEKGKVLKIKNKVKHMKLIKAIKSMKANARKTSKEILS